MKKKLMGVFRQPEFHAILFSLGLLLFTYPLLLMTNAEPPGVIYLALFLPWAIIIMLLFVMTRSYPVSRLDQEQDQEDGDITHV